MTFMSNLQSMKNMYFGITRAVFVLMSYSIIDQSALIPIIYHIIDNQIQSVLTDVGILLGLK